MSDMANYRKGLEGNSYTRESFIERFMNDPDTKAFMWEKLQWLDLSGLEFIRGGGYGIEFRGADLTGTNFSRSIMRNAHFLEAMLQNVNFSKCDLRNAVFVESDIRGAVFLGAKLSGASFYKATYDHKTKFPMLFDIEKHKMIRG